MAFPLMALISSAVSAKQKKAEEERARREAAARGEALRNVGQGGGLGNVVGMLGGLTGGFGGGEKTRVGGTSGSGMADALDDVDGALADFDRYKGY